MIPQENIIEILSYLDIYNLRNLRLVNRFFAQEILKDKTWKGFIQIFQKKWFNFINIYPCKNSYFYLCGEIQNQVMKIKSLNDESKGFFSGQSIIQMEAVSASSVDYDQDASNLLKYKSQNSFWSSQGSQTTETHEEIIFRFKQGSVIVSQIELKIFFAYWLENKVFPPEQIQIGFSTDGTNYFYTTEKIQVKLDEELIRKPFTSIQAKLKEIDQSLRVTINIFPNNILVSNFIKVIFLNASNMQETDNKYYIAVQHLIVQGIQLNQEIISKKQNRFAQILNDSLKNDQNISDDIFKEQLSKIQDVENLFSFLNKNPYLYIRNYTYKIISKNPELLKQYYLNLPNKNKRSQLNQQESLALVRYLDYQELIKQFDENYNKDIGPETLGQQYTQNTKIDQIFYQIKYFKFNQKSYEIFIKEFFQNSCDSKKLVLLKMLNYYSGYKYSKKKDVMEYQYFKYLITLLFLEEKQF